MIYILQRQQRYGWMENDNAVSLFPAILIRKLADELTLEFIRYMYTLDLPFSLPHWFVRYNCVGG